MVFSAPPVFTVGQINAQIKVLLESTLGRVSVRGELKEAKIAGKGFHLYGKMTDGNNNLSIVVWNSTLGRMAVRPETLLGQEVIATGKVSSFPGRGDIQLIVDSLFPVGQGNQLLALEALKQKLAAEGLFAPERKRQLPRFPRGIAVITSESGAAIYDITATLQKRYPLAPVFLFPAQVQGSLAAASILEALKLVKNTYRDLTLDVLILGRGGGASEDLSVFNDESVVRAAASMPIPVISAVGHQINSSILDLVADCSVATPTAAAAAATCDRQQLLPMLARDLHAMANNVRYQLSESKQDLLSEEKLLSELMRQQIGECGERLDYLLQNLEKYNPAKVIWDKQSLFSEYGRLLDDDISRLLTADRMQLENNQAKMDLAIKASKSKAVFQLDTLSQRLEDMSPKRVMERGYAILLDDKRHEVLLETIKPGDKITALVHGGSLEATVDKING